MALVDTFDPENSFEPGESPDETDDEQDQAAQDEEHLYAGKFRTDEDLERGYTEAESLIGRQGAEIGELKDMVKTLMGKLGGDPEAPVEEEPEQEFWEMMPQDKFNELLAENPAGVIGAMADRIADKKVAAEMARVQELLEQQGQTIAGQALTNTVADWMLSHPEVDDKREDMQKTFTENQHWFYDDLASGDPARVHKAMSAIATLSGVRSSENGSPAAGRQRVPRTAPSTPRPGGNRGKSVQDQILDSMLEYAKPKGMGIFG